MSTTKIEWADAVINPFVGCTRISAGCEHCYAERMAKRLQAMGTRGYEVSAHFDSVVGRHGRWNGRINVIPQAMQAATRRRKSTTFFVNSMSDLFHEKKTYTDVSLVLDVIAACPQHTFIVLTKRPSCMVQVMLEYYKSNQTLPNLALGVSIENQNEVHRACTLTQVNAAIRFVSYEPALGPLDIRAQLATSKIHGVICGGESGPGARPMHPDWARSMRDQCAEAGVHFFFKQWGEWAPGENTPDDGRRYPMQQYFNEHWDVTAGQWMDEEDYGPIMYRVGKHRAGRLIDGRTHNALPWEVGER